MDYLYDAINDLFSKLEAKRQSALGVGSRPTELKFPKIAHLKKALGEKGGEELVKKVFANNVEVTSKMDGQQFGVQLDAKHKPHFFSKSMVLEPGAFDPADPEYEKERETGFDYKDYWRAMKHFKDLEKRGVLKKMPANSLISGEFFGSKQPNVLKYDRVPKGNFVLFGVKTGDKWSSYDELVEYGKLLEVDVVPVLFNGKITDKKSFMKGLSATLRSNTDFQDMVKTYFEKLGKTKIDSVAELEGLLALFLEIPDPLLGGERQEGVVIKQWDVLTPKGKNIFLKVVRDEFAQERVSAWEDVDKSQRALRQASLALRQGRISQKEYDKILKENNYYEYLMRAESTEALFGLENRLAKGVAGVKEQRKPVTVSNVLAWLRNDLVEEGYPNYIYNKYQKAHNLMPKHLQDKNQAQVYDDFWRNVVMGTQSNWVDVTGKVK